MPTDINHENLRDAVTYEVRQQMTPYVLRVAQDQDDLRLLKWTVYGNEQAGEVGLVKGMRSIQGKLDTLIVSSQARENQWQGIRNALAVIGALSSLPVIQWIGKLVGLWP